MAIGDVRVTVLGACPSAQHVQLRFDFETAAGIRSRTIGVERGDLRQGLAPESLDDFMLVLLRRFVRRGTFTSALDFKTKLEAEVFQV